jgi:hypothetical protein
LSHHITSFSLGDTSGRDVRHHARQSLASPPLPHARGFYSTACPYKHHHDYQRRLHQRRLLLGAVALLVDELATLAAGSGDQNPFDGWTPRSLARRGEARRGRGESAVSAAAVAAVDGDGDAGAMGPGEGAPPAPDAMRGRGRGTGTWRILRGCARKWSNEI